MADNVIIPKDYVENIKAPVVFLVGPMGGTQHWHDWAIDFIHSQDPGICVASPDPILSMKHLNNALRGNMPDFTSRLDWERHYLEVASRQGVILAWLPNETQHDCGKVYGRDTRGELGEWRGRLAYDKTIQIVLGGEPGFDGIEMIKRNFLAVSPDMKFYSTLEETCAEAAKQAREPRIARHVLDYLAVGGIKGRNFICRHAEYGEYHGRVYHVLDTVQMLKKGRDYFSLLVQFIGDAKPIRYLEPRDKEAFTDDIAKDREKGAIPKKKNK